MIQHRYMLLTLGKWVQWAMCMKLFKFGHFLTTFIISSLNLWSENLLSAILSTCISENLPLEYDSAQIYAYNIRNMGTVGHYLRNSIFGLKMQYQQYYPPVWGEGKYVLGIGYNKDICFKHQENGYRGQCLQKCQIWSFFDQFRHFQH